MCLVEIVLRQETIIHKKFVDTLICFFEIGFLYLASTVPVQSQNYRYHSVLLGEVGHENMVNYRYHSVLV
jgi:hypothetical protein